MLRAVHDRWSEQVDAREQSDSPIENAEMPHAAQCIREVRKQQVDLETPPDSANPNIMHAVARNRCQNK